MPNIHPEIEFKSFTTKDHKTAYQIKITLNSNIAIAAKLPLVGEDLSDNALRVNALTLTYTSADSISDKEIVKGIALGGNIEIIDKKIPFSFNVNDLKETPKKFLALDSSLQSSQNRNLSTKEQAKQDTTSTFQSSEGMWLKIQKSLGPITLNRVGVSYKDGAMWLLLDSALNISVMEISLFGLGVGLPAAKLNNLDIEDLEYTLSGLEVRLNTSAVTINGGLLRTEVNNVEQYDGSLMVKAGVFALSALGSYTKQDGKASLFAYATIDYPLGGPPCFFITGGALGFGYNRSLKIPDIKEVKKFPLITAAYNPSILKGKTPGEVLTEMRDCIAVEIGQYWIAAGIKFTSFELIMGFALATVSFGNKVEIAILGIANLALPKGAKDDAIIAEVELALKAFFAPEEGVFSIEAQLTSNSYVLSRRCQLTGGFAFYMWYGNNPYAGDFVITLGGYHPLFRKPRHYPDVPMLGIQWVVSDNFFIKGGLYFALTPVCVMAGGRLEALWQSSKVDPWIRAYFSLYMDILISWQPYYYDFMAGISIGVEVDVLFDTISVHVGVDLHIWGPEFAGIAKIHLWIVSFTIEFGENSISKHETIEWTIFKDSFLPKAKTQAKLVKATAPAKNDNDKYAVCSINITNGLLKEDKESGYAIVDPHHFTFETSSIIPSVQGNYLEEILYSAKENNLGIAPVGIESLSSVHNITLQKKIENNKYTDVKRVNDKNEEIIHFEKIYQQVPKSLWGKASQQRDLKTQLSQEPTLKNILTGFSTSFKLQFPHVTATLPLNKLLYDDNFNFSSLSFNKPNIVKIKDDFPSEEKDRLVSIRNSIVQNEIRDKIFHSLRIIEPLGFVKSINLDSIKKDLQDEYFKQIPNLRYLGEEKTISRAA